MNLSEFEEEFYATYLGHMFMACTPTNKAEMQTLRAMVGNIFYSYYYTLN